MQRPESPTCLSIPPKRVLTIVASPSPSSLQRPVSALPWAFYSLEDGPLTTAIPRQVRLTRLLRLP
jgi:hypothetical protein